jgi:type I restriction enzyme M protein
MLDSDTKRRINTCRDILVGKVPDPKSQVEQITIAMIYKFMDDMDLQAEEMGGTRKFFAGEFERYAWAKLVAPGVSGQEMLNTYGEALQKMPENAGIPSLFRDIFRNAYLPYRDPETLRSFLREINGFSYDHSERLGDAFEYLLSVLGSQGDAGQFRTPRHIIDFMVELVDPKKGEIILDPACGTAGFLISSYKHILKANSTEVAPANGADITDVTELAIESPLRFKGDKLTPEDRTRLATNVRGYDISPDMVRLSLVNLYLHGFADPKIEEYDTLTSDDKWTEMADVILANPPFMSPKGGIKPHNRFQVPSKRSEVLFVDYIAEHLTPQGRAAIIVPEGIIFQSQSAYCALRKLLVDKFLVAVISLPAGVFNPYSGVKTSILILDRAAAKATDSIAFFKIENDGFGLGAQRRAVKGGQLPQLKEELGAWLSALRNSEEHLLDSALGFLVEKKRLAVSGEYNLNAEQYRQGEKRTSEYPLVELGSVATLLNGRAYKQEELLEAGPVPVLRVGNFFSNRGWYYSDLELEENKYCYAGDLLFAWSASFGPRIWDGPKAIYHYHIWKVVPSPEIDKNFLFWILKSEAEQIKAEGHGIAMVHATKGGMEKRKIPLPPLEVQQRIAAEIEGYRKVVDGARAVLENYRPHIPNDFQWPMVKLSDICERIMDGTHFSPSSSTEGSRLYITSKNIRDGFLDLSNVSYISDEDHKEIYRRCPVKIGDVLYTKDGSNTGLSAINTIQEEFSLLSSVAVLRCKAELLDNRFLSFYLNSDAGRRRMLSMVAGVAITRLTLTKIGGAEIPLPPLVTQKAIVAEIEAEQALVAANRDLIARFETKIEAAIARVWGNTQGEAA